MIDWKFANKLRPHNRRETFKHFMAKAMAFKILFNAGYYVYSEYELLEVKRKFRVADVYASNGLPWYELSSKAIVVEVESNPTKRKNKELMEFHKDRTLYIIDLRKISDDINEMEKQIRHIIGL